MASFKNKKNLLQQRGEYARYFDRLRGVDFSSDHNDVEDSRFAYLVNMYRDYQSGQGGAVETIPGFRTLKRSLGTINGIHVGNNQIYLHRGSELYYFGKIDENGKTELLLDLTNDRKIGTLPDAKTISFVNQGHIYILGGGVFVSIDYNESGKPVLRPVFQTAYIPTTYTGISIEAQRDTVARDYGGGKKLEQRNLLTTMYKLRYIADGEYNYFYTKEPIDSEFNFESNYNNNLLPAKEMGFKVYQYGVELPLAYNNGNGSPQVPEGYPNAIARIAKDTSPEGNGTITLVNTPPRPENNTWNPEKGNFDYTGKEIADGLPEEEGYTWPFAFGKEHDGIEVTVSKKISTLGGSTNTAVDQHSIITNCTIACQYDNRIFLSGNPDFPRHIFWCGIRYGEVIPSATYFGQLNYEVEGVSTAPVVAMMNIGDALMVLKKDSDEEESILIHTPQKGPDDVNPRIYPSQRGHKGLGCLGPCINFRDDPIFLSKNGVEALGHVNTKYRRAIRHRSSLIDAKLLNSSIKKGTDGIMDALFECDLKDASMVEYNGYLMILVGGKIFMADSRQMYSTPDSGSEYEWYYLENIGTYYDDFDEFVYAEFPTVQDFSERLEVTGGIDVYEAREVRDENGIARNLIGSTANKENEAIGVIESTNGALVYYKELPIYNEYTNQTGETLKFLVKPSGARTGGKFSPAVTLKVIGNDLFFYTNMGDLCKFNFDMRDPETGLIPSEYYNFDGRSIFSGCATKMDNCGIPHLTKTTVKRSTVIKTRSFEASGIKVKVRTNRKAFNQIARIVNGQATFDDPDFKAYSFSTAEKNIFAVNEREKKWVEKQIFLYSDEYCRPFAIHYIAYRYVIAGRYKE